MSSDNNKIFKLYENVANLGPAAESPVGPSNNEQVVVSIPSGFAVKDDTHNDNNDNRRKDMVKSNLLSLAKNIRSVAEDFKKLSDVPPWIQEKLAVSTQSIQDISDYYNSKTL